MEKIIFQNSKGTKLAGMLHLPKEKTKSAIIISHGFTSNKDRPRLIKLSKALSNKNFAVLRFDFGGCGESENRVITIKNQVDDLKSAIDYLRKNGYKNIGLLGESLGGLISIIAYDKQIKTIVLLAPVTKAKVLSFIKSQGRKHEINKNGCIIYQKDKREFKIPQEYLKERRSINQKEILSKIKCPTLIIHGNKDTVVPLGHSKKAMQFLSNNSKLETINGGDHVLDDKINTVIPLSVDWFTKHLNKTGL